MSGLRSQEAEAQAAAPLRRAGGLHNPSHALQLQHEYDTWRDEQGLNPTDAQRLRFSRLWVEIAQETGVMVP
jgi:hypothetical protein